MNIFVGIMIAGVVIVGILGWWIDNRGNSNTVSEKDKTDNK